MYANVFVHPDLLLSIYNQNNPRDQMIQMVKWHLSAFHAGR